MPRRVLLFVFSILVTGLICLAPPAQSYMRYETHVEFVTQFNKDLVKLLPRSMGAYLYQNRYDFTRGMTFMMRDILNGAAKLKDLEEIRREAFARLSRDIPYCVAAFKEGEIKLDTSATNLAGRLGMIAMSTILVKMPAMPNLEYLENFSRAFQEAVAEGLIDIWVYYDGYGDFKSLGELLERFQPEGMPEFRHVRNDKYPVDMREDVYAMFRAPPKFNRKMVFTNVDFNEYYSTMVNCTADAFVYIWKCSGMDLAHPSYAAPPGTVVSRTSRRREVRGGVLTATALTRRIPPPAETPPAPVEETEEEASPFGPEAPEPPAPTIAPPAPSPPPLERGR
ncbi:MAG: hypothetical protein LDL33_07815 [Desulfomonile sp.]|nr:hypothetical protein [Desulfomonile sp.]